MASTDEFHISPPHFVFDIFTLTLEQKIWALKPAIPLPLDVMELLTVHSIRQGDSAFFEYLMKNEKTLCPEWSQIGSLSYQFLLCQACEYSQPKIVQWLLGEMPFDHRFPEAEKERRSLVLDIHLKCDRRRHVDYQWPFKAIAKSGSVECFEMFRHYAPLSLEHCGYDDLMETPHTRLADHIKNIPK